MAIYFACIFFFFRDSDVLNRGYLNLQILQLYIFNYDNMMIIIIRRIENYNDVTLNVMTVNRIILCVVLAACGHVDVHVLVCVEVDVFGVYNRVSHVFIKI